MSERQLHIRQEYDLQGAWRFLSHHVRRYPQDLRAHTQRVLLAQEEPLRHYLAGTLQDVFIALENAGSQLREDLLDRVGEDLEESEKLFFQRWLNTGFDSSFRGQWRKGSLLSTGEGMVSIPLIQVEHTQENVGYSNVMEEVFACLEYGQIDDAQALLENEALAGRMNDSMEKELLGIYQHTRNKEGFNAMIKKLQEAGQNIPSVWLEMQQASEQW